MAGDWIKMRTNLETDPAVVRIASGLKLDRYSVVGRLHKIWSWANEHLTDGQDVPIDSEFLDALVESPGFSEQLRRVGWLSGRDGCLCFPNFERHNGASAKSRALDAERKRTARRTNEKRPKNVRHQTGQTTDQRERREEKSINSLSHSRELPKNTHLNDPQFAALWDRWGRHLLEQGKPLTPTRSESQLYELASFTIEEATAIVNFSISRGAKNLITNGDHKLDRSSERRSSNTRRRTPGLEGIIQ